MRNPYKSVRWGDELGIGQIPNFIFRDGKLTLSGIAIKVLVALIYAYRGTAKSSRLNEDTATVFVRQCPDPKKKATGSSLTERTGLSRKDIGRAVKQLVAAGYIQTVQNLTRDKRSNRGRLLSNGYIFLNPRAGKPLRPSVGTNVLFENGLRYFTYPVCLLTQIERHWSLASLTSSETRAYASVLYLAGKHRKNEFKVRVRELVDLTGMAPVTLNEALTSLFCDRGLLWITGVYARISDEMKIEVCDPFSESPLVEMDGDDASNPQKYVIREASGRMRRADTNICPHDSQALEDRVRSWGYAGPVVHQGNGDLQVCCPIHEDQTPSLSISPSKKGCWYCFGCKASGSFFNLIQAFRGTIGSTIEVLRSDVEATYLYRDARGMLIKRVERLPGKMFRQSVPAKGGWDYTTAGVGAALYNADLLEYADTVIVCEGEKDSDAITTLKLMGICTPVIAVTSGSADSWDPRLASQLAGKRVIIVPDDDEAGTRYADAIESSLAAEGIEHKRISFSGTDCKDATDYMERHGREQFEELIGAEWVRQPDGTWAQVETATLTLVAQGAGADCTAYEEQITV
jgi:5S rRNA maturation endonuclease (ribonuclease M5)